MELSEISEKEGDLMGMKNSPSPSKGPITKSPYKDTVGKKK